MNETKKTSAREGTHLLWWISDFLKVPLHHLLRGLPYETETTNKTMRLGPECTRAEKRKRTSGLRCQTHLYEPVSLWFCDSSGPDRGWA